MTTILIEAWKLVWLILAIPLAVGLVFCSLMANGYREAKQYAKDIGLI